VVVDMLPSRPARAFGCWNREGEPAGCGGGLRAGGGGPRARALGGGPDKVLDMSDMGECWEPTAPDGSTCCVGSVAPALVVGGDGESRRN
jgi:hypothetical protein